MPRRHFALSGCQQELEQGQSTCKTSVPGDTWFPPSAQRGWNVVCAALGAVEAKAQGNAGSAEAQTHAYLP